MPALDSNCSFTAAVADTHDCNLIPHRSKHSNCIYEVKMIGRRIDAHNIEPDISTRIVECAIRRPSVSLRPVSVSMFVQFEIDRLQELDPAIVNIGERCQTYRPAN